MEEFTEQLVKEWSWRLDDGIPDIEDPEKVNVLGDVLVEEFDVPRRVAGEQVQALIAEA